MPTRDAYAPALVTVDVEVSTVVLHGGEHAPTEPYIPWQLPQGSHDQPVAHSILVVHGGNCAWSLQGKSAQQKHASSVLMVLKQFGPHDSRLPVPGSAQKSSLHDVGAEMTWAKAGVRKLVTIGAVQATTPPMASRLSNLRREMPSGLGSSSGARSSGSNLSILDSFLGLASPPQPLRKRPTRNNLDHTTR